MIEKSLFAVPVGKSGKLEIPTCMSQEYMELLTTSVKSQFTNERIPTFPASLDLKMKRRYRRRGVSKDGDNSVIPEKNLAELQLNAFTIKTVFPQNVVLLKDRSIVVCDFFQDGKCVRRKVMGRMFSCVRPAYETGSILRSYDVQVFEASNLNTDQITFWSDEIFSKCAILPVGLFEATRKPVIGSHLTPADWNVWFVSAMIL